MARAMRAGRNRTIVSGVSASAKSRAAAGPVVVYCVRRERMHAMRRRKGSDARAVRAAIAVGFQAGAVRRRRRTISAIFVVTGAACPVVVTSAARPGPPWVARAPRGVAALGGLAARVGTAEIEEHAHALGNVS